ncbi:MAG: class II fumarate hydratase [Pseudomonadota bacterium]|nr:class II fumarate hydratase [Pseudomonadota bacterium]
MKKKITYRIEADSLGKVKVPKDALYGAQTQRAIDNFKISGECFPPVFLQALALLKASCALANKESGLMTIRKAQVIYKCAIDIFKNIDKYYDQFPIDIFQTGSGTSTNMNMNEVIANMASKILKSKVHPNDDVNMSQSSNDIIPSAIIVSCTIECEHLTDAVDTLTTSLMRKTEKTSEIKSGRTHLMDAVPINFSEEIWSWENLVLSGYQCNTTNFLPIGGTAVGTGINAPKNFGKKVCKNLNKILGIKSIKFEAHPHPYTYISSQDHILETSGHFLVFASALTKICNDLRWMNSGPISGLGEITLKPLQPGSSIMPGKINPVIPEAVLMAMAQVTGNHNTINIACNSGNFQLNAMLPVIARNILESSKLLENSALALSDVIKTFTINSEKIKSNLERNPIIATKLNEVVGYDLTSKIVKEAYKSKKPIIEVAEKMTNLSKAQLKELLDPKKLA